eukprot:PhF_6_TR40229/c0_g1_i4/m.59799
MDNASSTLPPSTAPLSSHPQSSSSSLATVDTHHHVDTTTTTASSLLPPHMQPFNTESPSAMKVIGFTDMSTKPGDRSDSTTNPPLNTNLAWSLLSQKDKDSHQPLPPHLNSLFHKIVDLSVNGSPRTPRNAHELRNKLSRGVLMEDADDDEFARQNKLQVIRSDFEKRFALWSGKKLMDKQATADMEQVKEEKSSILTYSTPPFEIPNIGVDPCPGCGAQFQNDNEQSFGFLTHERIHRWLKSYSHAMKLRTEYAERRYRLHCHW